MIALPNSDDVVARNAGGATSNLLHQVCEAFDAETAVASALAAALAALAFIRETAGDRAADDAAELLRDAVAQRRDQTGRGGLVVPGVRGWA